MHLIEQAPCLYVPIHIYASPLMLNSSARGSTSEAIISTAAFRRRVWRPSKESLHLTPQDPTECENTGLL